MPTGLKFKQLASINNGGLNMQAIPTKKPKIQPKLIPIAGNINSPQGNAAKQNMKITPLQQKLGNPFMFPIHLIKKIKPINFKVLKLFMKPPVNFDPVELAGITKERPEIIMMSDFLPVFRRKSKRFTAAGKMLDIQIAARNLKIENYAKLKKQLDDNEETKPFIEQLDKRWKKQVAKAKKNSQFLSAMMSRMRRTKSALNIRTTKRLIGKFNMKEFFTDDLQFTEDGFNSFSNSKILSQFLFDARVAASVYSPNLFDAKDKDRETDKDPIEIDKSVNLNDGKFAFNIEDFQSSANNLINMADIKEHSELVSSLPSDINDRIKLLLVVLSKEMRVSRGLGRRTLVKPLEETFGGADVGDPFIDIVGEPGDRITDIPLGTTSLSNLVRFKGDDNTIVLPFEANFITDENDRTYVPGTSYLVDSILQKEPKFSTARMETFKDDFETRMSDAVQLFNGLLLLNRKKASLRAERLFIEVIQDVGNALERISDFDAKAALVLGCIKLANDDMELKSMLFQFMLLLSFKKGVIGGDVVSEPFKTLSEVELEKFSDFSRILTFVDPFTDATQTSDQSKVSAALTQLAERISVRVFQFVASTSPANPGGSITLQKKEQIQDALLDSESNYPLVSMIKFIRRVDKLAGGFRGQSKALIDDDTGRTRFNRLSISTRAVLAFELYSAMYVGYTHSAYFGVTASTIRLVTDYEKTKLNSIIFQFAEDEVSKLANRPRTGLNSQVISPDEPQQQKGKNAQKIQKLNNYSYQEILKALGTIGGLFAIIIFGTLNDTARKVIEEDNRLRDFVSLMRAMLRRTKGQTNRLVNFFDSQGANKEDLSEFSEGEDANEKAAMLNEAQVNLTLAEVDDMERDNIFATTRGVDPIDPLKGVKKNKFTFLRRQKPFLDDSDIAPRIRQGMLDLFKREKYRDRFSSDLKILTVGIPAGFMDGLRGRVDIDDDEPDVFESTEVDVITIDVYKRDLELEDIIFKPQQFVFEMSRFISRGRFNRDRFNRSVLTHPWTIQKNFSSATGKLGREGDISDDPSYDFLDPDERVELMENHVISYLLGVYIKVMTGISTSEIDYLANRDITTSPFDEQTKTLFRNLVNKHISGIIGKPTTLDDLAAQNPQIANLIDKIENFENVQSTVEQINNVVIEETEEAASIETTQDIIDFMNMFSPNSFMAGAAARRQKALSPKIFERIFNVPVDPGEFDIDVAATTATKYGKDALKNLQLSKRLRNVPVGDGLFALRATPRTTRSNSVVYDEFFVTISTVGGGVI